MVKEPADGNGSRGYQPHLLAYYYPGFHYDPVLHPGLPEGWSEWELVRRARPFFLGHRQPRRPAWGFQDESDPDVLANKLAVAGAHGIDGLISIIYSYGSATPGLSVLRRALDEVRQGTTRVAAMWANHRRYWCYPETEDTPGRVYLTVGYRPGQLRRLIDEWCETIFAHPGYYRSPDGLPLFVLYSPQAFTDGAGSPDALARFVDMLRDRAQRTGLPGLHVHASSATYLRNTDPLRAGFDSCSDYLALGYSEDTLGYKPGNSEISLHGHLIVPIEMNRRLAVVADRFRTLAARMPVPYLPAVTVGRDCTPRVRKLGHRRIGHYSSRPVILEDIGTLGPAALSTAIDFLDEARPPVPMVFLNAWNEWTEGAYLEPDTEYGLWPLTEIGRIWRTAWTSAL
jgi:hypothetical protein